MGSQGQTLGDRVHHFREALEYSLSDLARESGISRSYLYQVESGESSPTEEKLIALSNALQVSVADLLGVHEDEPNIPESLEAFAREAKLPPNDVRMLARIEYRGKQPTTVEGWRYLYSAIRATSENGNE